MRPEVGVSRPTSMRASVVLPDPDSPTTASDSPSPTVNVTSSTATISSPRAAPRTRNTLRSRSTSSTGPALATGARLLAQGAQVVVHLFGAAAAYEAAAERAQHLLLGRALRLAVGAAVGERAPLGRLERRARPAGDGGQAVGGGVHAWPGREQGGRVRVQRIGVQPGARLLLHD